MLLAADIRAKVYIYIVASGTGERGLGISSSFAISIRNYGECLALLRLLRKGSNTRIHG